jgi:hypothetical protein
MIAGMFAIASLATVAFAQTTLIVSGANARAGIHSLTASLTPDPFQLPLRTQGALHVGPMRIGAGCRGYTATEPNAIIRFSGAGSFLRFFARSESNVTLIVHDPSGRFFCNDDAVPGRNHQPMVDLYQPRPGQYDVWIGTHTPNQEIAATLFVTTQRTERP